MSLKFWKHVLEDYIKKSCWQCIIDMIQKNDSLNVNTATLSYVQIWGLLYYKNIEKKHHLCISSYLYEDMFTLTHDFIDHPEYAWTHKWLIDSLYLSDLSKHLHQYIQHCSQCQLMQTSKHSLYELMQSILTSLQSFHILTIDFILVLSILSDRYDTVMSVTDKFSKIIMFIPEWKIFTVKNWVTHLMNCLALLNWDLSWTLLSDQDHKFMTALWKELFCQLHVDLLFLTAYHSQTDDSSEITN